MNLAGFALRGTGRGVAADKPTEELLRLILVEREVGVGGVLSSKASAECAKDSAVI